MMTFVINHESLSSAPMWDRRRRFCRMQGGARKRSSLRWLSRHSRRRDMRCPPHRRRTVSQVNKGIRRMPRRFETKKDAISCDKPWRAASKHWLMDFRMGQPGGSNVPSPYLRDKEKTPDELKHLSSSRKRNQRDSLSSGERNGKSPNQETSVSWGCGPATRHKL